MYTYMCIYIPNVTEYIVWHDDNEYVPWLTHWWLTRYIYSMYGKHFDFKKRRDRRKKSYERRAYESVDDRSHS